MNASQFLTAFLAANMFAASAQGTPITRGDDQNVSASSWGNVGELATQQWQALDRGPWEAAPAAKQAGAHKQGRTVKAADPVHDLYATAVRISEPASELLMLVALGGLAIMVRRKMPA
jgi:hypothetical protein